MTFLYGDLQFLIPPPPNIPQNSEIAEMQETISMLRQRLDLLVDKNSSNSQQIAESETDPCNMPSKEILEETRKPPSVTNLNIHEDFQQGASNSIYNSQIFMQVLSLSLSFCLSLQKIF